MTTTVVQTTGSTAGIHSGPSVLSTTTHNMGFQDLARGDRNGKLVLRGIPKFSDPLLQRQWMKEHMAAAFRFFGKHGYAEGIAGHISMRGSYLTGHLVSA